MTTFWDFIFSILDRNLSGYQSGYTPICVPSIYVYILYILCTPVQKVHIFII